MYQKPLPYFMAVYKLMKASVQVDPDEESLARLRALRGEQDPGPSKDGSKVKAKPAYRTAQDELQEAEAIERAAQTGSFLCDIYSLSYLCAILYPCIPWPQ